jgi:adenylate cyclase
MKRRSSAPIKARQPRLKPKSRNPAKVAGGFSSRLGAKSEVVQLREELHEALEQQTATADVLKVISRSTFDLQAVINTLVQSAARLCAADKGAIFQQDGDLLRMVANYGFSPEAEQYAAENPGRVNRGSVTGRALLEGRAIHVPDVLADPEYGAFARDYQRVFGYRTYLGVPLLRDGTTIGSFSLTRDKVSPFTEKQIELVRTFADQAVIAIENARLVNELRESLQQQTATADVLAVINSSPGNLTPVFNAMLEKAMRLCGAAFGGLTSYDGKRFHALALRGLAPEAAEAFRREPSSRDSFPGLPPTAHEQLVHADLIANEPDRHRHPQSSALAEIGGARTGLLIALRKDDLLVGSLWFYRTEVRLFTDKQITLLQNFAAQAVIAIENARLVGELRKTTEEVVKLNQQLEQRVADQVGEIERMGRLRRFLPPQVADLIVASGTEKQLESHRREITALFCDLRGFTGFSESADPEDVMALLRDYHAAIGKIIIKYSGTLERYAGDGVMVIFNDPVPVENPALQAVLMALEMREAIGALTDRWRRIGHEIGFGIGIAHGFATLGTIGFEGRFDYAAIGTVSNVASRLCDEAKPAQILISPRVLMAVENDVTVEPIGEFSLKGIRRPLAAYNVLASKAC